MVEALATLDIRACGPTMPRESQPNAVTRSPHAAAAPTRERLAWLARLVWTIELDYRQLKGELGLDHYEGRSWIGWHHHTALVTVAHGFLTLERLCPRVQRLA